MTLSWAALYSCLHDSVRAQGPAMVTWNVDAAHGARSRKQINTEVDSKREAWGVWEHLHVNPGAYGRPQVVWQTRLAANDWFGRSRKYTLICV